jgi:hypothetical protein
MKDLRTVCIIDLQGFLVDDTMNIRIHSSASKNGQNVIGYRLRHALRRKEGR